MRYSPDDPPHLTGRYRTRPTCRCTCSVGIAIFEGTGARMAGETGAMNGRAGSLRGVRRNTERTR
jgi:hypothetical protein